jgi:hypothetical protein
MLPVKVTLKTRKTIADLTPEDLRAFPIWKGCLDEEEREGQDETFVRPVRTRVIRLEPAEQAHVAADFISARGETFEGYVTLDSEEQDSGALFFGTTSILIPYEWEKAGRKKFARALGGTEKKVYPLRYRLRVPFSGERRPYSGAFE